MEGPQRFMAYISSRNFIHRRLSELRDFFVTHYGDGYIRVLSEKCAIRYMTLAEYFSGKWGNTNGRPGSQESVRLSLVSAIEAHARAAGWRSKMSVREPKTAGHTEHELTD